MNEKLKNNYLRHLFGETKNRLTENELCRLKQKCFPKKLYRYRPVNTFLMDTLLNDIAYLSPAINFNDPYDSGLSVNLLANFNSEMIHQLADVLISTSNFTDINKEDLYKYSLKEIIYLFGLQMKMDEIRSTEFVNDTLNSFKTSQSLLEQSESEMLNEYRTRLLACCFSEENDNILMWSHYAQYHQGICIEYDFSNISIENEFFHNIYPVKYSDKLFNPLLKKDLDTFLLAALNKAKSWKYENEWRLITNEKTKQRYKLNKPSAIILGTNISETDKAWITEICNMRSIPIKKAVMDRTQYKLHIK